MRGRGDHASCDYSSRGKIFSSMLLNYSLQIAEASLQTKIKPSKFSFVIFQAGVLAEEIGVIAPYKDQVNLLREVVVQEVEVNTVDQYQGRDKEIILYSGTRSIFLKNNPENVNIVWISP